MLFKIYRYNSGFRSNCILPKINTTNAKRKWLLNKLSSERSVSMMQSEYFVCFLLISSIWTSERWKNTFILHRCVHNSHWFTWLNKNCGFYLFYGNSRKKVFLFICVRVYVIFTSHHLSTLKLSIGPKNIFLCTIYTFSW